MKFALLMQRWPPHRRHPLIYPRDRPRHWMSGILVARSPAQKSFGETFGEAFGAATGVSDPRLQKNRIRNHHLGGDAATVAGYAGPGFHIWPTGHIPQNTDRIRFRDACGTPTYSTDKSGCPRFTIMIANPDKCVSQNHATRTLNHGHPITDTCDCG